MIAWLKEIFGWEDYNWEEDALDLDAESFVLATWFYYGDLI